MSVWLPIVDSLCFGVTSLCRLLLLQALTDFTEYFDDLLAIRWYVVDTELCKNPNLFDGVMQTCSWVYFFRLHCIIWKLLEFLQAK